MRRTNWGLLLTLLWAGSAQAISITATLVPPTPSTPDVGNSIFLDISISGLTAGVAPSLTAFDIQISFDPAVVNIVTVSFSSLAGMNSCTPATFDASCEAFADFSSTAGLVSFGAASFIDPATINTNQPDFGSLALLSFQAVGGGTTSFDFATVDLAGTISGTTEGPLSANATGTSVTIAFPVPEPGTALLAALGVTALAAGRRASGPQLE